MSLNYSQQHTALPPHAIFRSDGNHGPRNKIGYYLFSLMIRYRIFTYEGRNYVCPGDGINLLRDYNFCFQIQDEGVFHTIAHPWYNGILDAHDYMISFCPAAWQLILHELVQDKYNLFNEHIQSLELIQLELPSLVEDKSPWYGCLTTIVESHVNSVARILFKKNNVTKNRKWKLNYFSSFVELIMEEFLEDNMERKLFILEQENLYNKTGENVHSFFDLVKSFYHLVEEMIDQKFSSDLYLDTFWEEQL